MFLTVLVFVSWAICHGEVNYGHGGPSYSSALLGDNYQGHGFSRDYPVNIWNHVGDARNGYEQVPADHQPDIPLSRRKYFPGVSYEPFGITKQNIAPVRPNTLLHYNHPHQVDYHNHPKYSFKYNVNDPHSGDRHSQEEQREGDVVRGEYSVHEADGTVRTVKYTADDKNGFNAQVIRFGHDVHPETHKERLASAHKKPVKY